MENETIEIEVNGQSKYLDPERAYRYFGIEEGETKEITVGELLGAGADEYEIEEVELDGQEAESVELPQEASVVQGSIDQNVITSAQDLLDLGLENVFVIPRIESRHSALLVAIRPHQTLVITASVGRLSRPGSNGSNSLTLHGEVLEEGAAVHFKPQSNRESISEIEGMKLLYNGKKGRREIEFCYQVKGSWTPTESPAKQQAHGTAWITLTRASGSELRIAFDYLVTKD